jgi:hypothetical protein
MEPRLGEGRKRAKEKDSHRGHRGRKERAQRTTNEREKIKQEA